ncbi:hypothetical protein GTP41_08410 [Pseudoduganella sp. DS3]|uniref:Uncharacterized protein n=1 Tax=Pseudoduganella guangdongensis TaxID=2692179 RepID=A0A6N9HH18_9BURK|nr:hypothetical protein [Pseudoduganella guangdongensis]MYN02125.1 hypothetical protein [Pseudoduganella guangdongensis]
MRKLIIASVAYLSCWAVILHLLNKFGISGDYVASGTTAVVGYLAYLVFELGQISQLRSAAKILVLDIRNAEDAHGAVRGGASFAAWSKVVIPENNWPKLKQNFVSVLNSDEFKIFDQFFHTWSELASAKKRWEEFQFSGIAAKAQYVQQKLIDLESLDSAELEKRRRSIIDRVNGEKFLFEPDLASHQLSHFLTTLTPLTGTTGFEKLRKVAGIR